MLHVCINAYLYREAVHLMASIITQASYISVFYIERNIKSQFQHYLAATDTK